MKIAILSCNTGGGHNAAAAALAEELSARGHESRTYNTLDFLPKGAADLISRGHDFAYRYAPKLYGAGYRMEEKRPSPLLYENSIRGIGPLYEALVDLGADAAICVHVFPAMMMTELRCGYGLRMPTWFVATDFTCSPGVGDLDMDGYCIPHPALLEEFAAAGLDLSRLHATGIPVSPDFIRPLDKQTARRALHLENKRHVVVLACGSMGAGPMRSAAEKIARELSPSEDKLVMVCGSNRRLYRSSKLTLEEYPQIQVVGFTKRMPLYLHGCDALVTKAGGLTTTEAVAAGVHHAVHLLVLCAKLSEYQRADYAYRAYERNHEHTLKHVAVRERQNLAALDKHAGADDDSDDHGYRRGQAVPFLHFTSHNRNPLY